MTTISAFKANLAQGGARPNQFRVDLTFPAVNGGALAGQTAQILCKAASLPASTIEDITVSYRGRPVHFAGERSFQPWSVSIYNESNFLIRDAFERWNDLALSYDATNGAVSSLQYQVQLKVHQLDRNDIPWKTYTFYDAYPTAVGAITLDFDSNNQIEMFDVEFVYNYFVPGNL